MVNCSSLFGRDYITSYQEFYLAMTMAAECGRVGDTLDMSMMRIIDPKLLSKFDREYLQYLKEIGSVYDGSTPEKTFVRGSKEDCPEDRPALWFDVNNITELYGKLFREDSECYHWDSSWASETYGEKYLNGVTALSTLGSTVMHLAGHMLVGFYFGYIPVKKVVFHFNRMEARATYIYLALYACINSCENVEKYIEIKFEEERKELRDLDYFVLFESSRNAGLFTLHDWNVKRKAMEKNGIQQGSIVAMYKRSRITANNPAGYIKEAFIAKIESLGDGPEFVISNLSVNKTKEEQELDYLEIDEEYRHMFSDMLDFYIPQRVEKYNLYDIGVCEYFYTEDWLMLPLDKSDVVNKRVTIDGQQTVMTMNTVEAVYWILNEFGVLFDQELYRKMYNDGKSLLWDRVDGTPNLITDTMYD